MMEPAPKTWLKVCPHHPHPTYIHHPSLRIAPAQDLDYDGWVHPCLRSQHQCLCHSDEIQGNLNLVTCFHRLPSTGPTTQDRSPHEIEDRQRPLEVLRPTPDHDGKSRFFRPNIPAGDRRV